MQLRSGLRLGVLLIVSLALSGIAAPTLLADQSERPRYLPGGRLLDGDADWGSSNRDWLAFGSGEHVTIATVRPSLRLQTVWNLDRPATAGVVVGSDLYLVRQGDAGDELVVADLTSAGLSLRPIDLHPTPRGSLRIAQMDDYLLVAEDGLGVRVLQLPGHRHAGAAHRGHEAGTPVAIGLLAMEEPIHALAASLRTIYLATEEHLVEINASLPSLPTLVHRIPLELSVHALGANNHTVYLLGDEGLHTMDLAHSGASPSATLDAAVRGHFLWVQGRAVYVAAGDAGLQRFEDSSARAAIFVVAVANNFFSPAALNIGVNDTVRWEKPDTGLASHNVFSCTALEQGCAGQTSTQAFTSGVPTSLPFSLSVTFTVPGNNPYVCQVHATLGMVGNVSVSAGPAAPPGVPDGDGGLTTPMRVSKLAPGGANLGLQFDTSTCRDAVNHDLIFGTSADLPAVLGGTYTTSGSQCAIGASPFTWIATPSAPVGDFAWWILVADDGASVEGSWGKDGGSAERNGSGLNGSSGRCGNTDKNLTNTCGQ